MATWIALFRGINVGGRNILPMADLRQDLESIPLRNVRTYIQSGNVLFDAGDAGDAGDADALAAAIASRVNERHGFEPRVLLLRHADLLDAIAKNPFPEAADDPKSLHFLFQESPARSPNTTALDDARSPTERYALTDRVFYLHAPDGIGRSRLAANAERYLGVAATARNYRTVQQLAAMAAQARDL